VPDSQRAVELSGPPELKRLGRNLNGYLGETIELEALLRDCLTAARAHGWQVQEILPAPKQMLAFIRGGNHGTGEAPLNTQQVARIYISSGIHGDEPAGPLALRQLLQENQWPPGVELWLCPCLNPAGFLLNRRENAEGLDLNRQYLTPQAPETLAHTAWLQRQPSFDLCLCLHEDWESHGFYVYELNPEQRPSLAEAMIARVSKVCPIDRSESIEGRPALNGVIRPSVDPRSRPDWPESFFLLTYKTRLSYTLEAPSDFTLAARVAALVTGVKAAVETFLSAGGAA
jgi:murein peptide amidase A